MKRRYITSLSSQQLPQQCVFMSVGTVEAPFPSKKGGRLHTFFCGHATYCRLERGKDASEESITFVDTEQFWLWLYTKIRKGKTTWVFADELATALTCLRVWRELECGELLLSDDRRCYDEFGRRIENRKEWRGLFVDADPPSILSVRRCNEGVACFVDVRNYFDTGTAGLSKHCHIPRRLYPGTNASDDVWTRYVSRETEIIKTGVLSLLTWLRDNQLGSLKLTGPSLAMSAFRTKFMRKPIKIERPKHVQHLERRAYYGGRTEVLYQGVYPHTVHELDIQSMYAAIMRGRTFPIEYMESGDATTSKDVPFSDPGLFTCAECLLATGSNPFPVRFRHSTLWCVGTYWTTLCGPELRRAWQSGVIKQYGRWATYRCASIFDDYVDYFWNMRQEYKQKGDELYRQLCKLMLVGLFGKFGQRNPRWELCNDPPAQWLWGSMSIQDYATKEIRTWRSIAGTIYEKLKPAEHDGSFTAISAWITAYARERIREIVHVAGSGNVLYVVTDAVYCNDDGKRNLESAGEIIPDTLGKLDCKLSGNYSKFTGIHDYILGTKRVYGGATIGHTVQNDGRIRETVKQTLSDIISEQPLDGVVHYERIRGKAKPVTRGVATKSGWLLPIHVQLPSLQHLKAMRDPNNLPEFDQRWLSQESVDRYWNSVRDVEQGTSQQLNMI